MVRESSSVIPEKFVKVCQYMPACSRETEGQKKCFQSCPQNTYWHSLSRYELTYGTYILTVNRYSFYRPNPSPLNPLPPLTQNKYSFYHKTTCPLNSHPIPSPIPTQSEYILILPQYLHTYCTHTHFSTKPLIP